MSNKQQQMQTSINDVFAKTISNVFDSFPTIYSKGDVIKVINDVQASINALIDYDQPNEYVNIDEFKSDMNEIIRDAIEEIEPNDFCDPDLDSAELDMYNKIVHVTSIDFDFDHARFTKKVCEIINNQIDSAIEKLSTEQNTFATQTNVQSAQ